MDVLMRQEIDVIGSSVAEAFVEVLAYARPYAGCEPQLTEEHVDAATLVFREALREHLGTELYRSDEMSPRLLDHR